ncbi:homoserine kinase [Vampirovibrio chlorellavorus]|uniref:homoserine kinase n=1 Tax=Vampirovibrio chlorellavorus TaxID=758823 RepID=UPI0026EFF125|nr:homoserine kinase [Vampirovibrio chlorellavorus]
MFTVRVPATIANLGPGFDSFGMAVSLYNGFEFQQAQRDGLTFSPDGAADVSALQRASDSAAGAVGQNLLFVAMDRLFEKAGQSRPPLQVRITADIPVARGLGSSSTAVVAGLIAANHLLNQRFEMPELLAVAVSLEGHPDNVAPALLGGVVLYDERPYPLPWPLEWRVLTVSPDYEVLTEEARRILPSSVAMADAIFNLRKASTLTYALLREDPDAFRASLQDRLHQPYRRQLIAEYDAIERLVMADGALGMIISGSGSTMAIFYPTVIHAFLLEKLQGLIQAEGWSMTINDLTVDTEGAQLMAPAL